MAACKKKHLTQTRNVSRIRKIFSVVIKMVVSARQMGQWGRSIPGRRKSTFEGPEEGETRWCTSGSAGSLWLEHRLGVGVRRALFFLSISLWAKLDFFITVSRNLVPKEAKPNQKIAFLFYLKMSGTTQVLPALF